MEPVFPLIDHPPSSLDHHRPTHQQHSSGETLFDFTELHPPVPDDKISDETSLEIQKNPVRDPLIDDKFQCQKRGDTSEGKTDNLSLKASPKVIDILGNTNSRQRSFNSDHTDPSSLNNLTEKHGFILQHSDPYLHELGYAYCNICQMKLRWQKSNNISDHITTSKHSKTQAKIEQRLSEFDWLHLVDGVPRCRPCSTQVQWKNIIRMREHEENVDHKELADLAAKHGFKDELVKAEMEQVDSGDKITIKNNEVGQLITQELQYLMKSDAAIDNNVNIKCADGLVAANLHPFLLSTLLFEGYQSCDMDSEFVILCPEWSTKDVRTALDVLYLGVCQPDNQDQAGRVSRCLKDLNFVGVLGRSDSKAKERRTAVKEERHVDVALNSSSSDKRPAKNNRNVSDLNMATRLRQFPDLRRAAEGSGLECGVCSVPVDWRERNKISLHMRSAKHLRARNTKHPQHKEDDLKMKIGSLNDLGDEGGEDDVDGDLAPALVDSGKDEEEEEEEEEDRGGQAKRPRRSGSQHPRVCLEERLKKFKDLVECEGQVICRVCKILLDWTKTSRINEHMRSQKHIKAAREAPPDDGTLPILSEAERIKIQSQARRVKAALKKGRGEESDAEDEEDYEDETDMPFQEKLVQRMQEFPWMKKLPKVDEVRCIFCKCPVNWERKSHILDHIKSKKHIAALTAKRDKYPEVIRRMDEVQPKYTTESEKPNNGDRLAYRIHLRQGTPAIQKLWAVALLIGTMSSQISICYICFKLYLTQEDLMQHCDAEHKDMPNKSTNSPLYNCETKEFFCNGCNKYTEAKKSLMSFLVHNLICTKRFYSSPSAIKCFKCDHIFSAYKNFREHIESAHEDLLPERLMCTDCPQTYLTNEELKRHINQVHTEHVFACSECPATFKSKNSMKEHVVKHHIGVKNFSCHTCGKEFFGKQNLRMHMRIHVAPENRPHPCQLCGMRFIERKHLLNHQATHTNDRPHKCHLCDSRFKVRDWLSNHYIKQHNISIKEVEAKYKQHPRPIISGVQYQQPSYHH